MRIRQACQGKASLGQTEHYLKLMNLILIAMNLILIAQIA
jgi:hypothetical protein